MTIVNPTAGVNVIYVLPRDKNYSRAYTITLRRDGERSVVSDTAFPNIGSNVNSFELDCSALIMNESYFMEILDDEGTLLYRDKVYCTDVADYNETINSGEFNIDTAQEDSTYKIDD
jgi:hypothetical protein